MIKAYKYKVYRSKKQRKLHTLATTAGYVYNHCIALHKRYYRLYGKSLKKSQLQKHLAKLRKRNPYWMKLNSQTVQEITDRIDKAYQLFFKKHTKRPPTFKKSRKYRSFTFKQSGFKLDGNSIRINSIGTTFKFHLSRPYGKVKTITLKRDALGDFYIIIICQIEHPRTKSMTGRTAGFDFGLKTYLTSSDEEEIHAPLYFKRNLNKLKSAHRKLSKKQKGSNNWKRAKTDLNRTYRKVTNQRNDYQWKLAHELLDSYDILCFEDLNLDGMKRLWGRKVSDLSFYSFMQKLEYLAQVSGKDVVKIDRFFPSSKIHNECGYKNDIQLRDRTFLCQGCGVEVQRDFNAAKNIHRQGIADYARTRKTQLAAQGLLSA